MNGFVSVTDNDWSRIGLRRRADLFRIRGTLLGPRGVSLRVITVWMAEYASRETKFITLFPDKEE